ncbi:hypothetical protein [Elizabethkingia ursingii]|uniref:hypothetical protein n=1 Tax=Elizabethkingia ursingii TaxID=1756150 RepID=UPI0021A51FF9|nr:hypothetical protein [Elizabethkingia ursingii]
MKYRIALIFTLLYTLNVFAQENKKDPRYEQYSGGYGSNDGIYLFEDGRFILYGYATAVFGEYSIDKDICPSSQRNGNCLKFILHKTSPWVL